MLSVFHGTSRRAAEAIVKDGFNTKETYACVPSISRDLSLPSWFATLSSYSFFFSHAKGSCFSARTMLVCQVHASDKSHGETNDDVIGFIDGAFFVKRDWPAARPPAFLVAIISFKHDPLPGTCCKMCLEVAKFALFVLLVLAAVLSMAMWPPYRCASKAVTFAAPQCQLSFSSK